MHTPSYLTCAFGLCCTTAAYAELPTVPSGQDIEIYQEGLLEEEGTQKVYYLGVVAPEIANGGRIDFKAANADIDVLCETYALGRALAAENGDEPASELVIKMMDSPLSYGETNQDVRQYMGFYDISKGACEWH